jgi:mono/diheme cytochrome c family protein
MRLFLTATLAAAVTVTGSLFPLVAARLQAVGPEMPGRALYDNTCSRCHGPEGTGGKAPWLVPFGWSYSQALDIVRHGGSGMPAFPESELSDDALKQIVDYLKTLNQTHVK